MGFCWQRALTGFMFINLNAPKQFEKLMCIFICFAWHWWQNSDKIPSTKQSRGGKWTTILANNSEYTLVLLWCFCVFCKKVLYLFHWIILSTLARLFYDLQELLSCRSYFKFIFSLGNSENLYLTILTHYFINKGGLAYVYN